jgi:hypothetical protein
VSVAVWGLWGWGVAECLREGGKGSCGLEGMPLSVIVCVGGGGGLEGAGESSMPL